MAADIGEYIVGAYLKLELGCDVVDYNVRLPGGKLQGLGELDVVGYDFKNRRVYLCEVTTHIRGLLIRGSNAKTVATIRAKFKRQKKYAAVRLNKFKNIRYQFWSPYVPKGYRTEHLKKIRGLELFINEKYHECVEALRRRARKEKHDAVNPFFRTLQILEATRKSKPKAHSAA